MLGLNMSPNTGARSGGCLVANRAAGGDGDPSESGLSGAEPTAPAPIRVGSANPRPSLDSNRPDSDACALSLIAVIAWRICRLDHIRLAYKLLQTQRSGNWRSGAQIEDISDIPWISVLQSPKADSNTTYKLYDSQVLSTTLTEERKRKNVMHHSVEPVVATQDVQAGPQHVVAKSQETRTTNSLVFECFLCVMRNCKAC